MDVVHVLAVCPSTADTVRTGLALASESAFDRLQFTRGARFHCGACLGMHPLRKSRFRTNVFIEER